MSNSSTSSSTRARRRRAQTVTKEPAWLGSLWGFATKPLLLGTLIAVAGGLVMAAPWLNAPKALSSTWWRLGATYTDILTIALLLLGLTVPLLAGLWVNARTASAWDVELGEEESHEASGLSSWLARAGVGTMILGVAVGVLAWVSLQGDVLPSTSSFAVGQDTEYISARVESRPLRVMLPKRVTVKNIKMSHPQEVELTLSRPKEKDIPVETLQARQGMDVEGKRLTFVGLTQDARHLRVIVAGKSKQSIEATGRVGESVGVTMDGPTYEILEITRNHLGVLGPAVRLSNEEEGAFWLYQRQADPTFGPPLHDQLKLVRLETLPAAVFTVGPSVPFWPIIAGGVLLILGAAMLFGLPHANSDLSGRRWNSINEAGALAESLRDKKEST